MGSFRGSGEREIAREEALEDQVSAEIEGAVETLTPLYPSHAVPRVFPVSSVLLGTARDTFLRLKAPLAILAIALCVEEGKFRQGVRGLVSKAMGDGMDMQGTRHDGSQSKEALEGGRRFRSVSFGDGELNSKAKSSRESRNEARASLRRIMETLSPYLTTDGEEGFLKLVQLFSNTSTGLEVNRELDSYVNHWVKGIQRPKITVQVNPNAQGMLVVTVNQKKTTRGFAQVMLRIMVIEKPLASVDNAEPESAQTFAHTVFLTGVATQTFELKVHNKAVQPITPLNSAVASFLRGGKSDGAKGLCLTDVAVDNVNESSIIGVYIDPEGPWSLNRINLVCPPKWQEATLSMNPSPAVQISMLRGLSRSDGGDFIITTGGHLPFLFRLDSTTFASRGNSSQLIKTGLSCYQKYGVASCSLNPYSSLFRLIAVWMGLPSNNVPPESTLSDEGFSKPTICGSPPLLKPLPFSWRVRCAAIRAAVCSLSHSNGPGHFFSSLACLIYLYQVYYYADPVLIPDLPLQRPVSSTLLSKVVLHVLHEESEKREDTVMKIASSGSPAPLSCPSLGEWFIQRELLLAIASVRESDGKTPNAVISFLVKVLEGYSSLQVTRVIDDSSFLGPFLLCLGRALEDSHGAVSVSNLREEKMRASNPRNDKKVGWDEYLSCAEGVLLRKDLPVKLLIAGVDALFAQLDLECDTLHYTLPNVPLDSTLTFCAAPSQDFATVGSVASAAITAISRLQSISACPPWGTFFKFWESAAPTVTTKLHSPILRYSALLGEARIRASALPRHWRQQHLISKQGRKNLTQASETLDGQLEQQQQQWCDDLKMVFSWLRELHKEGGDGGLVLQGALSGLFSLQSASHGLVSSAAIPISDECKRKYEEDVALSVYTQWKATRVLSEVQKEVRKRIKESDMTGLDEKMVTQEVIDECKPDESLRGMPWFEAALDFGFWDDPEDPVVKQFQKEFYLPMETGLLSMKRHARGYRGFFSPLSTLPCYDSLLHPTSDLWDLLGDSLRPGHCANSSIFFGVRSFLQSFVGLGGLSVTVTRDTFPAVPEDKIRGVFLAGVKSNAKLRRSILATSLLDLWEQRVGDD